MLLIFLKKITLVCVLFVLLAWVESTAAMKVELSLWYACMFASEIGELNNLNSSRDSFPVSSSGLLQNEFIKLLGLSVRILLKEGPFKKIKKESLVDFKYYDPFCNIFVPSFFADTIDLASTLDVQVLQIYALTFIVK